MGDDCLAARDAAHLIHPVTAPRDMTSSGPRIVVSGHGWWVVDDSGRRLIDGFAGLWCVAVGHGRPEIQRAIQKQMATLEYFTTFHGQSHPKAIELAERLASMFPASYKLDHVMFSSGGSEANETNFKLVRLYWALRGERERTTIVARSHGYHGLTIATMTATGIMPMHWNFGPEAPGFAHVPAPYCYRCELRRTYPDCQLACAETLEQLVEEQGAHTIAAFIAEPVIGAGGIIPPPPDYFPRIREICDRHGILLIADEVVCGFGRTGTMFGFEHWGVRPDIVTLAKGLTSGYLPLGASVVSSEIWSTIAQKLPERMPVSHGFTYSGHPVCCAAALANIDILEGEGLIDNARHVGAYLLERMKELERYDSVGEVRGLGLMAGIEFVVDKESRRGFSNPHAACERVEHNAWQRGLYCRAMGVEVVGLAPPLHIDAATADEMVRILAESIEAMESDILAKERARPARRKLDVPSAAEFFEVMVPGRLGVEDLGRMELAVQFALSGPGGGTWLLVVHDGMARVEKLSTAVDEASATVRASAEDFLSVVKGELSGIDAFVSQRLTVEGDLDATAQLAKLGIL
jgi:putrescine---pyruvate transaminase